MGSKTTCAPACLARLAVLSVELLSTTIISDVKQGLEFATSDAEMDCKQRAIRRSSLNAGMTIERCMEQWMLVCTVRREMGPGIIPFLYIKWINIWMRP